MENEFYKLKIGTRYEIYKDACTVDMCIGLTFITYMHFKRKCYRSYETLGK